MTNFPRPISPRADVAFSGMEDLRPAQTRQQRQMWGSTLSWHRSPTKHGGFWGQVEPPRPGTHPGQGHSLPHLRECAETLCTARRGGGKSGTKAASACTQRSPRSAYGNASPHLPEFAVEKSCFNLGWDFPGAGELSVCPSVGLQPLPPL